MSAFLLRYLGVVDFGRYVTVTALIGIVGGVTDAGLTTIGSRELALRPAGPERNRVLSNLVALRLFVTPVGVVAATAFSVVAGYDRTLVYGTLLAGAGLVLVAVQSTMMMELAVDLRIATVTAFEVLRSALTAAGAIALVALGASLLPFFAVQIAVGVALLAATARLLGRVASTRLVDRETAWRLVRETLPMAAAIAMNVIYFRVLVILMSLLATATATGLFSTSFRIFELLFGVPTLVLSVALPVFSVAGRDDLERLRYGLQRTTEVALIASTLLVLVIAALAEPAIRLLGGPEYVGAAPILQIQAVALVGVFLGQVFQLGLVAIRNQRALAAANGVALALVLALGLILIPTAGAKGAAAAAVIAESALAVLCFAFLWRARRAVVPNLMFAWKVALAAALAAGILFVPRVGGAAAAVVVVLVYSVAIYVTGALPREVIASLVPRSGART